MLKLDEVFYNPAKHMLREKKKMLGGWLQTASPFAAEIFAKAGIDILMIDMEHGPNNILSLIDQLRAMGRFSSVPFARAPWNDMVMIKRMLDAGLYGILVPFVNTAEEAEQAVKSCKYPRAGVRGVAPSPRAPGWNMNSMNYMEHANDEIVVMVAVETPEAAQNIDEILKVDGLDGIFIGSTDLACSMGYFCKPNTPEVRAVIRPVEEKVLASNKFLATVANGFEAAKQLYDRGYSLVMVMSDGATLGNAAMKNVELFKEAYPER